MCVLVVQQTAICDWLNLLTVSQDFSEVFFFFKIKKKVLGIFVCQWQFCIYSSNLKNKAMNVIQISWNTGMSVIHLAQSGHFLFGHWTLSCFLHWASALEVYASISADRKTLWLCFDCSYNVWLKLQLYCKRWTDGDIDSCFLLLIYTVELCLYAGLFGCIC